MLIPAEIGGIAINAIGYRAFLGKALTEVLIPSSVKEIDEESFAENQITKITIPDNVAVGKWDFKDNPITEVTIGDNVSFFAGKIGAPIGNGFRALYNRKKRKAGTYIYDDERRIWRNK